MKGTLFERAFFIALEAHDGQTDKNGNRYILHPLRVMSNMNTCDEKVVALLHDVIEDTTVTLEELANTFPPDIIEAIKAITHLRNEPNEDYLARVKDNPIALRVKFADLYDNLLPSRLNRLDIDTQKRLRDKYFRALKYLSCNERRVNGHTF